MDKRHQEAGGQGLGLIPFLVALTLEIVTASVIGLGVITYAIHRLMPSSVKEKAQKPRKISSNQRVLAVWFICLGFLAGAVVLMFFVNPLLIGIGPVGCLLSINFLLPDIDT